MSVILQEQQTPVEGVLLLPGEYDVHVKFRYIPLNLGRRFLRSLRRGSVRNDNINPSIFAIALRGMHKNLIRNNVDSNLRIGDYSSTLIIGDSVYVRDSGYIFQGLGNDRGTLAIKYSFTNLPRETKTVITSVLQDRFEITPKTTS